MAIWKGLGYNVVIFLAGPAECPGSIYEAAKIDGAGPWRIFRSVTGRCSRPRSFYILIMTTIVSFDAFAPVWIMTGPPAGGPLNTTKVVSAISLNRALGLEARVWRGHCVLLIPDNHDPHHSPENGN